MTINAIERRGLTVVRAAWLFDGAALSANPTVVIDGDTITSVGSEAIPNGANVVELAGATILPGLVDSHVHLAFDASEDPVGHLAARDDAAALAAMAVAARRAARGGVTTVRDLGDRDYLSLTLRSAAASDSSLPTILAAGPPITSPGGHCHFLGEGAQGVDGVRAAVLARAERGVDVIKIMASGGNLTPGSRPERAQFGLAELRVAVDEAHRLGLPITAHAHGTGSIVDAVAAGMDSLEHVTFMTEDGVDEIPAGLLESVIAKRVTLSLTLGIKPVPGAVPPPAIAARLGAFVANAGRLYRAGAPIIVGTDAGLGLVKPPDALRYAPDQLRELGMTQAEALRTITSRAAEVVGLGDRKGRLVPGYDADLLVVDGNPLDDPAALHRIRAVYVRGQTLS